MATAANTTTAATNATAGLRRTAAPRAPPELSSYKTRFNAYLQHIGLPSVDDLTPENVTLPGDIESTMCSWAEHMSTNPPRYMNNQAKLLKADGVGNGFGLIIEYLKDRFGRHVDWTDETWFTLPKGALVKKLERDNVRLGALVRRIAGRLLQPALRPPAIQSGSRTAGRPASSSKGKKKNENGVAVSDVIIELARALRLKSGTAFEDIPVPLALFPRGLPSSEMTKYKLAMRVASAAATEDQEKVFRATEIDDAELVRNAKALDEECRKWIAAKLGWRKVGKLTAQVLGLGANAGKGACRLMAEARGRPVRWSLL